MGELLYPPVLNLGHIDGAFRIHAQVVCEIQVARSFAELAQLQVSEDELASLAAAMQNILDLAAQMQTVDTADVPPVSNPLDDVQQFRPDAVTESDQRELYQSI